MILIMNQDEAGAAVGIVNYIPSFRHLVLARNSSEASQLRSLFQIEFGITLEEDFTTARIGERLGVIALSFGEGYGKVAASDKVIEAVNINEAMAAMPEIQSTARRGRNIRDERLR